MNKRERTYHLFLFFEAFSRGLIEVYSLVLLYKKGFTINSILIFLLSTYIIGMFSSSISLKVNTKIILIISNIIYGISFLYLSIINKSILSLMFFSLLLSFSNYSYHIIRHYYALHMLNDKKKTNIIVNILYLGTIFSSLIGSILLDKISPILTSIIVLTLSIISCIPILKYEPSKNNINKANNINKNQKVKLGKNKIIFSILEQFKVLLTELQPLFIYIYIKKSYLYIGIFNIIMNISSLCVVLVLSKHISSKKLKYITVLLGITLFLKINIKNYLILLIIALLEGTFIKIYEIFSLRNLYDIGKNNIKKYLIKEEYIFLSTKSIIILLSILFNINLKTILYFYIIGIIISGFFIDET